MDPEKKFELYQLPSKRSKSLSHVPPAVNTRSKGGRQLFCYPHEKKKPVKRPHFSRVAAGVCLQPPSKRKTQSRRVLLAHRHLLWRLTWGVQMSKTKSMLRNWLPKITKKNDYRKSCSACAQGSLAEVC